MASPTDMPSGADVGTRTWHRLNNTLDQMPACDPADLLSVADAVEALDGGLEAVRQAAAVAADFTTADPNFGHQVLALLLLEGAVNVLTWNWDTCIERSSGREQIHAIVDIHSRVQTATRALLKVHGCASRPATLLITTDQLANPPDWTRTEMAARLADSCVVFVGIGDIAGYVVDLITRAVQDVGGAENVRVATPSISDEWASTQWAELVPDLAAEHRLGYTSDEFLDLLGGAYIRVCLETIRQALDPSPALSGAFAHARTALEGMNAVRVLLWLRSCAYRPKAGTSVLRSDHTAEVLIALGLECGAALEIQPSGRVHGSAVEYHPIIALGLCPAEDLRREAERRLERFLSRGGSEADAPTFLVVGAIGGFHHAPALPGDLMEAAVSDDLVGGALAVEPRIVDGSALVQGVV